jgi:hypothetical protein
MARWEKVMVKLFSSEGVRYEVALETLNLMNAIHTANIWREQQHPFPDPEYIAEQQRAMGELFKVECELDMGGLDVADRVIAQYAPIVKEAFSKPFEASKPIDYAEYERKCLENLKNLPPLPHCEPEPLVPYATLNNQNDSLRIRRLAMSETAQEIVATMLGNNCTDSHRAEEMNDQETIGRLEIELEELISMRNRVYRGDPDAIDRALAVYGPIVKKRFLEGLA